MKLWEKVNNITGNDTKARYLVEYVNAGAKFILASLPEKFLWTIASEVEVTGWNSAGTDILGNGSSLAYDKILAVYRYDNGKKRIAEEAPDNSIHIFDEASSLLTATEMFPKYYKLSGKIYIKPDPDYNSSDATKTYTPLGGSSTTVNAGTGDKGVIVYSAPPIIDENTDDWILTEYENIAILYACSLDYMRLSAYYRGLCKTEIDKIFATTIESFSNTLPSAYPVFNFTESVPSGFSLTKSIPTFSFNKVLPSNVSLNTALPSAINVSKALPTGLVLNKTLDTDFTTSSTLPSYNPESVVLNLSSVFGDINNAESILETGFTSGDSSAKTSKSAIHWLEDEDPEMSKATNEITEGNLNIAKTRLETERTNLEEFSQKVAQNNNEFASNLQKYSQESAVESQRINAGVANYQAEIQKESQRISNDVSIYGAELQKEVQRFNSDIAKYQAELSKEQLNTQVDLQSYQADLQRAIQKFQTELNEYQAEIQKENARVSIDLQNYSAKLNEANIRYQTDSNKFQMELTKSNSYLQESQIRLQSAGAYTQKSRDSIQSSQMFLQRAIGELTAITGAIVAPEQQQQSQRREQGATS